MKTIERIPIVQQVVNNLRDYILSGAIHVGDKLPSENDLCKELSVGRSTIREAFRILQANGYVEIKPGRGAFVARTKEQDLGDIIEWFVENEVELKDCIEVRTAIEPLSVKLAIARCTDEDIEQLAKTHEKFVKAVENKDITAIAKYDERFHNLIVEKSKNKLLISINRKVSECVQSFRAKTFMVEQNAENAVEPHTNIMNAIRSRDAEAGELFVRKHIQKILEDLTVIINK
jgi:GntR family transcriptional repressor for pyruvate dehydrogenase complex